MTTDSAREKILDSTVRQLWEGAADATADAIGRCHKLDEEQLLALAAYWGQVADTLKDAAREARVSTTCLRDEAKRMQLRREREAQQSSANVIHP
jgi:hypothetical protein